MNEHAEHDLKELRRRIGDVSQLVSTRAARLSDGSEDGVRVIDARATGGLSTIDPGRPWARPRRCLGSRPPGQLAVHDGRRPPRLLQRAELAALLPWRPADDLRPPERRPAVQDEGVSPTASTDASPTSPPATSSIASSSRTADWWPRSAVSCARRTSSAATCCCGDASRCPWARRVVHVEDEVVNQGFAPLPCSSSTTSTWAIPSWRTALASSARRPRSWAATSAPRAPSASTPASRRRRTASPSTSTSIACRTGMRQRRVSRWPTRPTRPPAASR